MVRWNKAYLKGTDIIVRINDILSRKDEYQCMSCRADMIARKGEIRAPHFAHKIKTDKCDAEGYFHKLGKKIFKKIYDESSIYEVNTPIGTINLKDEYGECKIEDRESGLILKGKADLNILHLRDEKKDILVEIFFSHQVTKRKIDSGARIIEVRLPINVSNDDDTNSNDIEDLIEKVCTPPLSVNENIRLYNFEENVRYEEEIVYSGLSGNYNDEFCLNADNDLRHIPNFNKYSTHYSHTDSQNEFTNITSNYHKTISTNTNNKKEKSKTKSDNWELKKQPIIPEIVFDVDMFTKAYYPNITHEPNLLPNYQRIIKIIVKDEDREYSVAIDYNKKEIFYNDIDKKIPQKWRKAVKEYIQNLRKK